MKLLCLHPYVIEHVQDAAVSGPVHSLISGDEHCEGPGSTQRRRQPTVLQEHKEKVIQQNLHHFPIHQVSEH